MNSIESYKISDLREIAKQNNYFGFSRMNKRDLYDFLVRKQSEMLVPNIGIPIPIPIVVKKPWEERQREINYVEFMAYDRFKPNYKEHEHAFKKSYITYRISGINGIGVPTYLENARETYENLSKPDHYKVQLILWTEWFKDNNKIEKIINSRMVTVYQNSNLVYNTLVHSILDMLEALNFPRSGFSLKKVLYMDVDFHKVHLVTGGTYVELEKWIKDKKAIINPKNNDNECFKWAVIAAIFNIDHPERMSSYKQYENKFNWSGLTFPMDINKIDLFENRNIYGVNVIYVDDKREFAILRKSKKPNQINLFYASKHYSAIRSLSRLLSSSNSKDSHKQFYCTNCLNGFNTEKALEKHEIYCINGAVRMVASKDKILKYTDGSKQFKVPFIIYADFESIIDSSGNHIPSGFCTYVKFSYGRLQNPKTLYRGEDCVEVFIKHIKETVRYLIEEVPSTVQMIPLTEEENKIHNSKRDCDICGKPFNDRDNRKVRDHCHYTGKYRCAAHGKCNFRYKIPEFIPVAFHNLSGYDVHLFIKELSKHFEADEINCIAESKEKYISITINTKEKVPHPTKEVYKRVGIRFIDTLRFMQSSLSALADSMDSFKILGEYLPVELMSKKGVYPYEYIDSFNKFDETELPSIDKFYSSLNLSGITQSEHDYAKKVWRNLCCRNMGDYHDVYLLTDVLLLADIFESFRDTCLKVYKLDPAQFYTAPGLAFQAALKYSGVELELLSDVDMFQMFEYGIRGGITQSIERYSKANNKYMDDYNPNEQSSFIQYLDANNLYGSAMSQDLPYKGFKWVDPNSNWYKNGKGYLLDVDVEYPKHLDHSDFPFLADRMNINGVTKLVPNMLDKKNYVVHYKTLRQALDHGLKLIKINRILEFDQKPWLKGYIDLNTNLRTKATSEFEKNFYKLMNNAVFGKTMENIRNHKNFKLVTTERKYSKYVSKPNFKSAIRFTEDLVGLDMGKTELVMSKPIYVGQAILDLSKIIMYEFHYDYAKTKWNNIKLLYQDTDSLIYNIKTEDFYKDISEDIASRFDTSNYINVDRPLQIGINKKVIGLMKDEMGGNIIKEFVTLNPKVYAYKYIKDDVINIDKKCKGVKRSVVLNNISFNDYIHTLNTNENKIVKQNLIRSNNHNIKTIVEKKRAFSTKNDKRIMINNIESIAIGLN